jgi:hypothetical protein
MIGHGTVFIAALATSAAAYLGLPTSTAPERCATRPAPSPPMGSCQRIDEALDPTVIERPKEKS